MALAECPADRIDSLDERSIEAETCRDHYQPALEYLLEAHEWDFAIRRVPLAQVDNDRPSEWGYAYKAPTDMAAPRHVLPFPENVSPFQGRHFGKLRSYEGALLHKVAGGIVYASWSPAVLEYVTNDPSEAMFTAKFARALAYELAQRIVMPLKKDSRRQGELVQFAEVALERAKAEDMNRDPESVWDYVPEVDRARAGYGPGRGIF